MNVEPRPEFLAGRRSAVDEHLPAFTLAGALAAGIFLDRFGGCSSGTWLAVGLAGLVVGLLASRLRAFRLSSLCLLAALAALGGFRHHQFWWTRQPDNVLHYAPEQSVPVRLRGTVASTIAIRKAEHSPRIPPWMQIDHSIATLRCEQIGDGSEWIPVSGDARLDVEGHLIHIEPGDRVEVVGHLSRPNGPDNPGDFDFRLWMRMRGLDVTLRAEHPITVRKIGEQRGITWQLMRQRARLRLQCEQIIAANLSQETVASGLSILLGDRSQMTVELRDQFIRSGTMHLLAISGMHVGLLLGMVWPLCRLLNLPRQSTALVLLLAALGYASLTDQQPSVLRATLLAAMALAAYVRLLPVNGINLLALCAAMLLLWHPETLFDVGAQLSFLAVAVLIKVVRSRAQARFERLRQEDLRPQRSPVIQWLLNVAEAAWELYLVSAAIWLATAPLTLWTFQMLAPAGIVVNILLVPFSSIVMALGFLLLTTGLLLPELAGYVGTGFDAALRVMLYFARAAADWPWGHVTLPAVPTWWVVGFYLILLFAWRLIRIPGLMALRWQALAVWTVLGLSLNLWPRSDGGLTVTALSVGHGSATVLQLPNGRTLAYDVGTYGDGRSAGRAMHAFLWDRRIPMLDAVIISHADADHFNGLTTLMETVPIGAIFCARTFLDFSHDAVADLCETASRRGIPIRIIQAGDRLDTGSDAVPFTFLHPDPGFEDKEDNANSAVLLVEFAGKRMLLTGDVEGAGQMRLQQATTGPFDVVFSPHHGAKGANPASFYGWANPKHIVVSTGAADARKRLSVLNSADVEVLSTADSGAIAVRIEPDGNIRVTPFLKPRGDVDHE